MARDKQMQTNDGEETRDILELTPKQFSKLIMMRAMAGVPKQPDLQAEIERREEARRQSPHSERR